MNPWKEAFDKNYKPRFLDLEVFFNPKTMKCFYSFIERLNSETGFLFEHYFTKTNGWVFKIGPKNVTISTIYIKDNFSFFVNDFCVKNESDINIAFDIVINLCNDDFYQKILIEEEKRLIRNKKQIDRTAKRMEREKNEFEQISHLVNNEKFNVYKWSPRLSLSKLKRLYMSSAKMLLDSDLLTEVGFTLYYRCLQGKEERDLYHSKKIKCHNCEKILSYQNKNDLVQCDCGYQYTAREYGRSYQREWMPHGRAQDVFDRLIDKWPKAKTDAEKMNLIDWIIHECHKCMISGTKADSVAKNLLGGSRSAAEKLILELAFEDILA